MGSHFTLHSAHYILHSAHYNLHSTYYKLHTAHCYWPQTNLILSMPAGRNTVGSFFHISKCTSQNLDFFPHHHHYCHCHFQPFQETSGLLETWYYLAQCTAVGGNRWDLFCGGKKLGEQCDSLLHATCECTFVDIK